MYRGLSVLIILCLVAFGVQSLIKQASNTSKQKQTKTQRYPAPEIKDNNSFDDISLKLRAPLTTYGTPRTALMHHCKGIEAIIEVPEDAPTDLGIGAYVKDQDGTWFQQPHLKKLTPGKHELYFPIDENDLWQAEPYGMEWNAYRLGQSKQYGLYFWSQQQNRAHIQILHLREVLFKSSYKEPAYTCNALKILSLQDYDESSNICFAQTGERWEVHCRPDILPRNPFNDDTLSIKALITDTAGIQRSYRAFYYQPIQLSDAGDHEQATINKPGYYILRYRPQQAGTYQVLLQVKTADHSFTINLPVLTVSGEDFDDYVRIDQKDPRYFSIKDQLYWPNGLNIRSVNDSRGHKNTRCDATPVRGTLSYEAYLDRLSRAGANCAEIWMCSWNLALEWRKGWPGYYGAGYYHEGNAARLDRILDAAYEKGIRVILVLNNHGQASSQVDSEWKHHPYNRRNGGFLSSAKQIFTDEHAHVYQGKLRRYLVARYADHPAIMCWKLWTEQDLTDVGLETRNPYLGKRNKKLRNWHQQACKDFKSLDHYQHPVVTHWSSDFTIVDSSVAQVTELDAIFIDAYHHRVPGHRLLADLLMYSIEDHGRGLARYKKPILCTEFGGTPMACNEIQLTAEHLSGPWAGLMSGHAGSPLIWWFEWVDQQDLWHPYRAIGNYMQSETSLAGCTSVKLQSSSKRLWTRAMVRKGRMLGYVLDARWGYNGTQLPLIKSATLTLGNNVKAGPMHLEWWDASLGQIVEQTFIEHTGGVLRITIPPFRRHLAFKLYRP